MATIQCGIVLLIFVASVSSVTYSPIGSCVDQGDGTETCYYYTNDTLSWNDANASCAADLNGELMTIQDETEQQFLRDNLDHSPGHDNSHQPWIGLSVDSYSDWTWIDGSQDTGSWSKWTSNYPEDNNYVRMTRSATTTDNFLWTDAIPSAGGTSYICEDNNIASCMNTTDIVATLVNGKCFRAYIQAVPTSWYASRTVCEENSTGLAIIKGDSEFNSVKQALTSREADFSTLITGGFWIGLSREDWVWIDGSFLTYSNWAPNFPRGGGLCAHLDEPKCGSGFCPDFMWLNQNCSSASPSICEERRPIPTTAESTVTSGTTASDDAKTDTTTDIRTRPSGPPLTPGPSQGPDANVTLSDITASTESSDSTLPPVDPTADTNSTGTVDVTASTSSDGLNSTDPDGSTKSTDSSGTKTSPFSGTGPTEQPGTGSTPTPGTGSTPSQGTGSTPTQGTRSTPTQGTGSTPSLGTGSTPSLGTGTTPSPGTGSTPTQGTGSTPSQGTGSTPSVGTGSTVPPVDPTADTNSTDAADVTAPSSGDGLNSTDMESTTTTTDSSGTKSSFSGTGSPGTGSTPSPGTGSTPSPGTGSTPSPGTGSTSSPGTGSTPSQGTGSTPSPGTGSTPSQGTGSTPSPGTGSTPSPGTGSTPSQGTGSTPSQGTGSTPSQGTGSTPSQGTGPTQPGGTGTPGPTEPVDPTGGGGTVGGLSAGAIAGIVVGCVAGVVLILLLIICLVKRARRKRREREYHETVFEDTARNGDVGNDYAFAFTNPVFNVDTRSMMTDMSEPGVGPPNGKVNLNPIYSTPIKPVFNTKQNGYYGVSSKLQVNGVPDYELARATSGTDPDDDIGGSLPGTEAYQDFGDEYDDDDVTDPKKTIVAVTSDPANDLDDIDIAVQDGSKFVTTIVLPPVKSSES